MCKASEDAAIALTLKQIATHLKPFLRTLMFRRLVSKTKLWINAVADAFTASTMPYLPA